MSHTRDVTLKFEDNLKNTDKAGSSDTHNADSREVLQHTSV